MVPHLAQDFVIPLRWFTERIPVPELGQPHKPSGLITENERTSLRKLLNHSMSSSPNGTVRNSQVGSLSRDLNDLLAPDDLSEL